MHRSGFSAKKRFQKWYKRIYQAIMGSMLLNALLAWNASFMKENAHLKMPCSDFMMYISQEMMNYKNDAQKILTYSSMRRSYHETGCTKGK